MPRVSRILESSLYVDDLPRAVTFYAELFGLELFFHDSRMAALGVPGAQVLLLFKRGATNEPAPGPGGGFIPPHHGEGNLHLCFAIASGDLAKWESYLSHNGIAIESRLRWARGGTSLYFRDPEGNSLEVATPGLWPNA
jgi:catechol 2,3-dioxygenase-like lactoylglutathione lyase family enzyme